MHKKYAKDGFVAVSVSFDDPRDAKARKNVEAFLQKQSATFLNVILDAKPEEWTKKLTIDGPPCIYVFNRDNHTALKMPLLDAKREIIEGTEPDFAKIEKKVIELLKK
jgi:hypothetical protein